MGKIESGDVTLGGRAKKNISRKMGEVQGIRSYHKDFIFNGTTFKF